MAQAPQGINYQAIARDAGGNPLATQTITVQFVIHQTTAAGAVVYDVTHSSVVTNPYGLFNLVIGQGGTVNSGNFTTISWGADLYFLEVIVNGTPMGTTQFMSVPYAMHATSAGNGLPPGTIGQTLRHDGTKWVNAGNLINDGTNVGIATAAPVSLFSVGSASQFQITGSGIAMGASGVPGTPAFSFTADPNTGIYNPAADQLSITTGGVERFRVTSTQISSVGLGSAGVPAFSFTGDPNTGFYNSAADEIMITTGGFNRLRVSNSQNLAMNTGSAAVPPWSFGTNNTSGMYSPAAGELGLSASSLERIRISSVGNVGINVPGPSSLLHVGGAARLGVASTTTGSLIFNNATNANAVTIQSGVSTANYTLTLPLAQGGASTFLQNDGTGILSWQSPSTTSILGASAATTSPQRSGEVNTGFYSPASGEIGAATLGSERLLIRNNEFIFGNNLNSFDAGSTSVLTLEGSENAATAFNFAGLRFSNDANNGGQTAAPVASVEAWSRTDIGANRGELRFRTKDGTTLLERMSIDMNGNVGINTTIPSVPLHVNNTSGQVGLQVDGSDPFWSSIYVNATAAGAQPNYGYMQGNTYKAGHRVNAAGDWLLDVNGLARMTVLSGGNVGIGNTSPAEALDVAGNVQFSGALMPGGNSGNPGEVLVSQGPGITPAWSASAALPGGSPGQTLRYGATQWVATSNLINDGTNIGIGTSPSSLFHLTSAAGTSEIRLNNTAATPRTDLTFSQGAGNTAQWGIINEGTDFRVQDWTTGGGAWTAIESTTGTKYLYLAPAQGNVGVGTSSLSSTDKLTVEASSNNAVYVRNSMSLAGNTKIGIDISMANGGNYNEGVRVNTSGATTNYGFLGTANGSAQINYGGSFTANGASTATNYGLYATASGGTNNYAAIFDQGNVGIGIASPSAKLQVDGSNVLFNNPSGPMALNITGTLLGGSSVYVDGKISAGAGTPSANAMLIMKDGHLQSQQSTPPAAAAGAACNCAAPTLLNATDAAGVVYFTPGAAATAGVMVTVTFNKTYASNPIVVLTPRNSIAATAVRGHDVFVNSSTTAFTISYNIDPNLAPAVDTGQNQFFYYVIETQ